MKPALFCLLYIFTPYFICYTCDLQIHLAGNNIFFQAEDCIRDYKVTVVQTCALPIYKLQLGGKVTKGLGAGSNPETGRQAALENTDRKSTRLNSSHLVSSYALFC